LFLRSLAQVVVLAGLALVDAAPGSSQPAFQVADIATGSSVVPRSPFGRNFAAADGTVFFFADDGLHGLELWRSDGTEDGTFLVKDICPGLCPLEPSPLAVIEDQVYFFSPGLGIWRSDGTAAGTVQISSIVPLDLEEVNGKLLFVTETALWASDGTASGTAIIRNLPDPTAPFFLGKAGGVAYLALGSIPSGRELWKTDGTAAGTVLVKKFQPGEGPPSFRLTMERYPAAGGRLFFSAYTPGESLWATDGTEAGTYQLVAYYPHEVVALGEEIFFQYGSTLARSDGTQAGTVVVHTALYGHWDLAAAGNTLFFASADDTFGRELWKSDGTAAGTMRVTDLAPGPQNSLHFFGRPNLPTALGSRLVFFAQDGTHGEEPWVTDGTAAGTASLGDLNPGPAGSGRLEDFRIDEGVVSGGRWFFGAYVDPTGWGLWTTDGTAAGTELVRQFPTLWSSARNPLFTDHAGTLFLALEEGNQASALWRSDGSPAGTARLKVFGSGVHRNQDMVSWNGHVYYLYHQLWQSDGTEAGTLSLGGNWSAMAPAESGLVLVEERPMFPTDAPLHLVQTDGTAPGTTQILAAFDNYNVGRPVAFRGGVALASTDLWLSDGTVSGTGPVGTSAYLDSYQPLTAAGDRLFFWASEAGPSSTDFEPWVSNGTPAGTRLLRDIRPGAQSSQKHAENAPVAALGHRWFFLADDGVSGEELWVSDGTTPGTRRVRDIRPGAEPARIESLVAGRNRVWFSADDGAHGRELWMSDGTEAGTRMVRDIAPGAGTSWPRELEAVAHILLFSAFDPAHGVELWRSDGTETGTVRMLDIAPGPLPSSPMEITASGPYLYFAANDGTTGFEPWALDRTLLGGFLTAIKKVSGQPVPGGTLTYTIVITNVGAGPHPDNPGDELVDVLPAGLTLTGATANIGTITTNLPANRVAWNGALPVGGTATVTIEATVGASRGTVLRNRAELSFDANGDGAHEPVATVSAPADALVVSGPLSFHTVPPCRLLDTRSGTPLASGTVRTVALAGSCGIPADAEAVAANLTVVNPSLPGYIKIWPAGAPVPEAIDLSFNAGALRSNNATLSLNGGGSIDIQATLFGASPQTHLVLDVSGYYRTED
jgi:uncharacterized repeat protein (TIGR01451 family)